MSEKFSIDAQLEEIRQAIDYVPQLEGRFAKKSLVEFRQKRLRAAARTLAWVKDNEASIRHWLAEQKNKNLAGELHNGAQN